MHMRFWVRVPVLSEQITETEPRLSTAFKSLMMAFCRAIFWVPRARTIVTMELRASGIAATARATANIRESRKEASRYIDRPKTSAQITRMIRASFLLKLSRLCCRGVLRCWVWFMSAAILPSSVSMPVPVTSTVARP